MSSSLRRPTKGASIKEIFMNESRSSIDPATNNFPDLTSGVGQTKGNS